MTRMDESPVPTIAPTAPSGQIDFELMVMPADKPLKALTDEPIKVSLLIHKNDDTEEWTTPEQLFESCDQMKMYCGKEFVLDAQYVKSIMFMNEGTDNFRVGDMKIMLDGVPMYAVNPRPEYVINNKKPVYELTTISPCPPAEKHHVQVKINTGRHSSGGG